MADEQKTKLRLEIAHVLFIDIVGYSKLSIDGQRRAIERLNEIVQSAEEFQKAEATRRLVKIPTGDGMALVFYDSPESPVECAMEVSRKLSVPGEPPVRMGIHSGPVSGVLDVNGRGNVAGEGINTAQRVMSCGDAGHILLSRRVAQDLSQFKHWRPHLHDLGETEVKHGARVGLVNLFTGEIGNSDRPSKLEYAPAATAHTAQEIPSERKRLPWLSLAVGAVVLLALVGVILFLRGRTGTKLASLLANIPEKSIAVMPFENRSRDADNAYFADGIQDEILTRLSNIADLKVISRTSTQHYKSAPENLPEIGKQLRVAHIVEGSVQKSGDTVRVNVQLIKAANDSHLWAETFDRKLTDIFAVESEVAKTIADQLRANLTEPEQREIASKPTENPQAYDAYLRGLAYSLKSGFSPSTTINAQNYLRQATKLDPTFARAWALLSYVNSFGYITAFLQPTEALREETRRTAETAVALQPDLGEAILAQAFYHYACLKDYDVAEKYLEKARPRLPNSSRIPEFRAYITRRRGQWKQSDDHFREAEQLDPRNPSLLSQHAFSHIHLRQFRDADHILDQILNIVPDDVDSAATKAAIAQCEGDLTRAAAILAPLHPPPSNVIAIERQAYQAVLERRTAPIIPTLQEIVNKADPALGYFNGELRFWLGWAEDLAGDHAEAVNNWQKAGDELQSLLGKQPENHFLIGDLALIRMLLGDKDAAWKLVDRSFAVNPVEKDAVAGPRSLEILARVAAGTSETDRAITAVEKLLGMPVSGFLDRSMPLTSALLRLDPMFDPLRNDPRFQKLVASPAPK